MNVNCSCYPFAWGNRKICSIRFEYDKQITHYSCMKYRGNISSIFSINSGANAPELIENIEDIFFSVLIRVWIMNRKLYEICHMDVLKGLTL